MLMMEWVPVVDADGNRNVTGPTRCAECDEKHFRDEDYAVVIHTALQVHYVHEKCMQLGFDKAKTANHDSDRGFERFRQEVFSKHG